MIHICELFSGIGAQSQALKNIGIEHDSVCCEIDAKAHASYCAIHGDTPNLGDITKVERLPSHFDLLTWSYPCTSCSIAGKQEGMVEGSGTASSLAWEVIRLLRKAKEEGNLPEYLLMENVPAILNKRNIKEFERLVGILDDIGYTSMYQVLNAKDYGAPQNRKRCFMVSTLHHGRFVFPEPCPDGRVLKDILQPPEEVPEKCWLSSERIAKYEEHYRRCQEKGNGFGWNPPDGSKVGKAVTTSPDRPYSNMLIQCGNLNLPGHESSSRVYDPEGISPTVTTPAGGGHMPRIKWPCDTKRGYMEAQDGDGLVMARPTLARGTVQSQQSPTVTCGNTSGVVVDILDNLMNSMNSYRQIYNCIIVYMILSEDYANAKETYAREILSCMWNSHGTQNVCKWSGRSGIIQKEKVLFEGVHEIGISENGDSRKASEPFECTQHIEDSESIGDETNMLLKMWEYIESGCSSYRWESTEQYRRKFASAMSELSSKSAQGGKESLCDLWTACQGPWLLQQALFALSEVWRSLDDKDAEVLYRLWRACECERIMREALSSCAESRNTPPLRIRYLTTKEVWRLQGFSDEAYYKAKAVPTSDTQLYKQAGNSIAVPCLEAIFKGMFLEDSWKDGRQKGLDAWQ